MGNQCFQYIKSLNLLPETDEAINEGVTEVKRIINRNFKDDEQKRLKWIKYVDDYVIGFWIKKIKPKVFCTYWQPDRTNNFTESNNHLMNDTIRAKPSINLFISKYERMCKYKKPYLTVF